MAQELDANAVILTKEFMRQLKEIENWRSQQNVILRKINNVHAKLTSIKGEKMVRIADKAYQKLDSLYKQLKHLAEQEAIACRDSLLIIGTDMPDCMNPQYHSELMGEKRLEDKEKKKQEKRARLMQQQGLVPPMTQPQLQELQRLQHLQQAQQAQQAQQQLLQQQLMIQQQFQFRGADQYLGLPQQPPASAAHLATQNLAHHQMASPPAPAPHVAAAAASASASAAQAVEPLPPGAEVAAKIKDKKSPGSPEQWILARVVKYIPEKDRYEVEDVDPGEETTIAVKHVVPARQIMPLPDETAFESIPELPKDFKVIALFPETTTFYEAIVAAPPKRQRKQGLVPEYQVMFQDDDEEGVVPKRKVSFRYVLPFEGGFFWMHALQQQMAHA